MEIARQHMEAGEAAGLAPDPGLEQAYNELAEKIADVRPYRRKANPFRRYHEAMLATAPRATAAPLSTRQRKLLAEGTAQTLCKLIQHTGQPIANAQKLRYDLQKTVQEIRAIEQLHQDLGRVLQLALQDKDWTTQLAAVLRAYPALRLVLANKEAVSLLHACPA